MVALQNFNDNAMAAHDGTSELRVQQPTSRVALIRQEPHYVLIEMPCDRPRLYDKQ